MTGVANDTPQPLVTRHLKSLRLPTVPRACDTLAGQCAAEGVDHARHLPRLAQLELIDRERRMVERRIRAARVPTTGSLDGLDFKAMPSLDRMPVMELARRGHIGRQETIIAVGNGGTARTHVAPGPGSAACRKGLPAGLITASALVHELMEARDGKRLLRPHEQLSGCSLPIIDEPGWMRAVVANRRRTAVRGLLTALRTRFHHRHVQPAVRRMDRHPWITTSRRRASRPADTSCPQSGDRRRKLSVETGHSARRRLIFPQDTGPMIRPDHSPARLRRRGGTAQCGSMDKPATGPGGAVLLRRVVESRSGVDTTRAFIRNMEKLTDLPVLFQDERLSTFEADQAMLAADLSRAKRAQKIDAVAAAVIQQSALDRLRAARNGS